MNVRKSGWLIVNPHHQIIFLTEPERRIYSSELGYSWWRLSWNRDRGRWTSIHPEPCPFPTSWSLKLPGSVVCAHLPIWASYSWPLKNSSASYVVYGHCIFLKEKKKQTVQPHLTEVEQVSSSRGGREIKKWIVANRQVLRWLRRGVIGAN